MWLICETYGEEITNGVLTNTERNILENNDLLPDAKTAILTTVRLLRNAVPILIKLQKVQFYLFKEQPNIPRRLFGINYVSVLAI